MERGLGGEPVVAALPHGYWKISIFVAWPRAEGVAAMVVLDGPINGHGCLTHVERLLVSSPRPPRSEKA